MSQDYYNPEPVVDLENSGLSAGEMRRMRGGAKGRPAAYATGGHRPHMMAPGSAPLRRHNDQLQDIAAVTSRDPRPPRLAGDAAYWSPWDPAGAGGGPLEGFSAAGGAAKPAAGALFSSPWALALLVVVLVLLISTHMSCASLRAELAYLRGKLDG